jgi:AcrR family transcriptional regulator
MTHSRSSRPPGRPRSVERDQSILAAALQELTDVGYDAMSIEGTAARAHVGKTTIYRRWPSKDALVLAAIQDLQAEAPIIDTGNLQADLLGMVEHALALGSSSPILQKLAFRAATELAAKPEMLQDLLMQVVPTRLHDFARLIERARERGELRADLSTEVALGMIAGPIFYHWLLGGIVSSSPPPADLAEQIVEAIFHGLAGTREALQGSPGTR